MTVHRSAQVWALRPWRANALMRRSYRAEGFLVIAAAILFALAVPVAGAVGTVVYDAQRRHNETHPPQALPAVLLADTRALSAGRHQGAIQWNEDGHTVSGQFTFGHPQRAGESVMLWRGTGSQLVSRQPISPSPLGTSIGAALAALGAAAGLLGGTVAATRAGLERRRRDSWEREWVEFANSADWRRS